MVEVVFTPVALVQTRLESVEGESTFKLVKVAFEAIRLVAVASVSKRFVIEPFVATKLEAKRFVEVVLVPVALVQTIEAVVAFKIVTSPKLPFQRRDGVPRL